MTEDIQNMRQNHPELIVRDLAELDDEHFFDGLTREQFNERVRHILKFRGVNKWFRVRKLLIQLKERWKVQAQGLEAVIKRYGQVAWDNKDSDPRMARKARKKAQKLRGYRQALVDCRQQVRALTHSPRDVDFPQHPREFGVACILPDDFPTRPNKRYFWTRKEGKA
jgi:hypothetical protein